MESFVPSNDLQTNASATMASITDYTDIACTVKLITVPFVASRDIDPTTIPGNVVEFAVKTSSASPNVITTPGPTASALLWPDPVGGWTFIAGAGTYPLTVYGYRVDNATPVFLGCKNIPAVTLEAAGATLVIGEVSLPISNDIFGP